MLLTLLPSQKISSVSSAIVIDLHIIIIAVCVVLQVKGGEGKANDIARGNGDIPGTVSTMRVVCRMTRAGDGA